MRRGLAIVALLVAILVTTTTAHAQTPVSYRLSFPERVHRLMQVDVTFLDVPAGALQLRMSRSSPGRYALHEFAKNIVDVRITDGGGRELAVARPNPHQWDVTGHDGTVRVTYRIFGDRVDGTYLGIDNGHAHINMPAALMWARGFEGRSATVRVETPPGASWRVATQLLPGQDPFTFNAPNLQYLMDSPTEVSNFSLRTFTVSDERRTPVFRVAAHHTGSDAELDAFTRDVESIVKEARNVFGEFPSFDGNTYTFIADYLPWANGDGMEHRNSTILTSSSSLATDRADLLDTASHEFFHAWNVERIRPRSLEPFNFEEANMSGELWLAEGVTSYYGPLIATRAGVATFGDFIREMARVVNISTNSPGRQVRSAVEMSQLAPFVDAAVWTDRTAFDNTYISYYTWGEAIGLGLDLTLRDRTDGKVTLDDFMRLLWERHGRTPAGAVGVVANPYTLDDLKNALAAVSGDAAFANDFFARYIQGREVVDYARLLARAGLVLRRGGAATPTIGTLRLQDGAGGVRITAAVPFGSPAYKAGIDRDDVIVSVGGSRVSSATDIDRALAARKAGDSVTAVIDRRGQQLTVTIALIEEPRLEIVAAEQTGQSLTPGQTRFREAWLRSGSRF
jgi:predicted metalloprotease with PDZ domain